MAVEAVVPVVPQDQELTGRNGDWSEIVERLLGAVGFVCRGANANVVC